MKKESLEYTMREEAGNVSDSEEMFWLRQNDDLQSKLELGKALSGQLRFREAASVWSKAAEAFPADPSLYLSIGGAYLTVLDFDCSFLAYKKYLDLGGSQQRAAFPLGIWYYLKGSYESAVSSFEQCLPCDNELLIAVIYWHSLSCLRSGKKLSLLAHFHPDMDTGHHSAYRLAVSLAAGCSDIHNTFSLLASETDPLSYCIIAYGLFCILQANGETNHDLLDGILRRKSVMACIPYLAAWNDSATL